MVPVQGLALEEEMDDDREDSQRDGFLDDLELHQVEGPAVAAEADAVGRYREAILEESDPPGEEDDQDQRPAGRDLHFLQFEMAVPRERHEDVRAHEHQDSPDSLHTFFNKSPQRYNESGNLWMSPLLFFATYYLYVNYKNQPGVFPYGQF